jgi:hypothetical protein
LRAVWLPFFTDCLHHPAHHHEFDPSQVAHALAALATLRTNKQRVVPGGPDKLPFYDEDGIGGRMAGGHVDEEGDEEGGKARAGSRTTLEQAGQLERAPFAEHVVKAVQATGVLLGAQSKGRRVLFVELANDPGARYASVRL